MALSARFCWWLSGGTSWIKHFFLIPALNSSDALLSNKCVVGFTVPLAVVASTAPDKL